MVTELVDVFFFGRGFVVVREDRSFFGDLFEKFAIGELLTVHFVLVEQHIGTLLSSPFLSEQH